VTFEKNAGFGGELRAVRIVGVALFVVIPKEEEEESSSCYGTSSLVDTLISFYVPPLFEEV
jgi:hypothetical protein